MKMFSKILLASAGILIISVVGFPLFKSKEAKEPNTLTKEDFHENNAPATVSKETQEFVERRRKRAAEKRAARALEQGVKEASIDVTG